MTSRMQGMPPAGWHDETCASCTMDIWPGHHFWLFQHEARLLAELVDAAIPEGGHAVA